MTDPGGKQKSMQELIVAWWRKYPAWVSVIKTLVLFLIVLTFWQLIPPTPKIPVGGTKGEANRYLIGNVAQVITACGAVAVIWLTAKRMAAMEKQADSAQDQAATAQSQLVTAQEALEHQKDEAREQREQAGAALHVQQDAALKVEQQAIRGLETERYGRAIEQLGHDKIGIRTGGLFALEALAVDAPKQFAETVYENLVAYLVEYTKPDPVLVEQIEAANDANAKTGIPEDVPNVGGVPVPKIPKIETDVQTAIKILSRQRVLFDTRVDALARDNEAQELVEERALVFGVHLVDVDLSSAWLREAIFQGATLTRTDFREADLTHANFREADLTHANFREADLTRTDFREADLTHANFREADLTRTDFRKATITNTDFHKATITHANFHKATITNTLFAEADLTHIDFRKATITNTDFRKANLNNTTLPES